MPGGVCIACDNCRQVKPGVKLNADDMLCPECYDENERKLKEMKEKRKGSAAAQQTTAPPETTNKTRQTRQTKQVKKISPSETCNTDDAGVNDDAAIPSVRTATINAGASDADTNLCGGCEKKYFDLNSRIEMLSVTVAQQDQVIQTLMKQLNFVLSFLDIHDNDTPSTIANISLPSERVAGAEITPANEESAPVTREICDENAPRTFAQVVQQAVRSITQTHTASDRDNAVTAMYVEQINKERRANSFVISGLMAVDSKSDNDIVKQLCEEEFGLSVDVLTSKRIGRLTSADPRNLLVYIRSRDQAQTIVQRARRLRKSANVSTRAHVFINPNLTKAEAKAQYQLRQRRRAGNQRMQQTSTVQLSAADVGLRNADTVTDGAQRFDLPCPSSDVHQQATDHPGRLATDAS